MTFLNGNKLSGGYSGRFLRALLILVLCAGLPACKANGAPQDDLTAAREAKIEQDWAHVARLTQRFLRSEIDPEKRWDAWKLIIEASEKMSESVWVIDYLEAALIEYDISSPHYSELLRKLGAIYVENRQWDRASAIWERQLAAQDMTPNSAAEIYRNQGRLHFIRHNFVEAREMFLLCEDNAVAVDLLSGCIYDNADTFSAEEKYEESLEAIQKIFTIPGVPDDIMGMAYLLRGDINEQLGNKAEAKSDFEKALEFHPNAAMVEIRIKALR